MKRLLALIATACLLFPTLSLAEGNVRPTLNLEIHITDNQTIVPEETCIHPHPIPPDMLLDCYAPKATYTFALIAMHVNHVPNGFLGVPYGVAVTGQDVIFMGVYPCPGFCLGPGTTPGSVYFNSIDGCRQWWEHPGYLAYFTMSSTPSATWFDIVSNEDLGHYWVLNCDKEYDINTLIGCSAQWGGPQTIICGDARTAAGETTWGTIKGLYR